MNTEDVIQDEPGVEQQNEPGEAGGPGEEEAPPAVDPVEQQRIGENALDAARESISRSLLTLGFVAFDGQGADNTSSGVLVSEQLRRHFRRDAYVGVQDTEQGIT